MNLESVLTGSVLLQDEWSKVCPLFGKQRQLKVIGYFRKGVGKKTYILECSVCRKDPEMFGDGYFKSSKGSLLSGSLPCGCSNIPKWSKEQHYLLCKRKAESLGYTFNGFVGEWINQNTKLSITCVTHGEWKTNTISNLVNHSKGCPDCNIGGNLKPDDDMIKSFFDSGAFHPGTKFWRSDRKTKQGAAVYWNVHCPICDSVNSSFVANLQKGHIPCPCSTSRQKEAYINIVYDQEIPLAVKFGIAVNSQKRVNIQNSKTSLSLINYAVFTFSTSDDCKRAEQECKQTLECCVLSKSDIPDGYTETTWLRNLDKIKQIYKKYGGVEAHASC